MENKETPYAMSEKNWNNTFFPNTPSNFFPLYDLNLATKVSEEGKLFTKLMKTI